MKLRNKKTGEIGWLYCDHISVPKKMTVFAEDKDLSANHWDYNSLAELNEEWGDAPKEPKEYWYINDLDGKPMKCELRYCSVREFTEWIEKRKQIGNYFETKEEAELAVRKLKAWKRLKDKGFKFERWQFLDNRSGIWVQGKLVPGIVDQLDILFGGEE